MTMVMDCSWVEIMALELVTMVMVAILGIIMMTMTCGDQDWYMLCPSVAMHSCNCSNHQKKTVTVMIFSKR